MCIIECLISYKASFFLFSKGDASEVLKDGRAQLSFNTFSNKVDEYIYLDM